MVFSQERKVFSELKILLVQYKNLGRKVTSTNYNLGKNHIIKKCLNIGEMEYIRLKK